MNDQELFPARKFNSLRCIRNDRLSIGGKSKNPFLKIKCKQSVLFSDQVSRNVLFFATAAGITRSPCAMALPKRFSRIPSAELASLPIANKRTELLHWQLNLSDPNPFFGAVPEPWRQ